MIFKQVGSSTLKGFSFSLPINHILLKSEDFNIRAIIKPAFKKVSLENSSFARIQLLLTDYLKTPDKSVKLLDLKTPEESDLQKEEESGEAIPTKLKSLESLPYFELNTSFKDAVLPFNVVGWNQSVEITNKKQKLIHFSS